VADLFNVFLFFFLQFFDQSRQGFYLSVSHLKGLLGLDVFLVFVVLLLLLSFLQVRVKFSIDVLEVVYRLQLVADVVVFGSDCAFELLAVCLQVVDSLFLCFNFVFECLHHRVRLQKLAFKLLFDLLEVLKRCMHFLRL